MNPSQRWNVMSWSCNPVEFYSLIANVGGVWPVPFRAFSMPVSRKLEPVFWSCMCNKDDYSGHSAMKNYFYNEITIDYVNKRVWIWHEFFSEVLSLCALIWSN